MPDATGEALLLSSAFTAATAWGAHRGYRYLQQEYNRAQGLKSFSDPRERMAGALLRRGSGSVDEIMEAAYGQWPPAGLNIAAHNSQQVRLRDFMYSSGRGNFLHGGTDSLLGRIQMHFRQLDKVGADANLMGPRHIGVNTIRQASIPAMFGRSDLSGPMGHEALHILQGDHAIRYEDVFTPEYPDTLGPDRVRLAPVEITNRAVDGHLMFFDGKLSSIPEGSARTMFNYLLEGFEMQARLHELMAEGYQHWQRLPGNEIELNVALLNTGLEMPEGRIQEIRAHPDFEAANARFSTPPGMADPNNTSMRYLNMANGLLTEEGKTRFSHMMPEMYADMIEMYGDGPGRARFGLGENPRLAFRLPETVAGGAADVAENVADGAKRIHGGFVTDVIIGGGVGVVSYLIGGDLQRSGQLAFETAVPFGETAIHISEGNTGEAMTSAVTETAGIGGAVAGAAWGAAIGSTVPIVGTIAGGIIGAVIGGVGCGFVSDFILTNLRVPDAINHFASPSRDFPYATGEASDNVMDAVESGLRDRDQGNTPQQRHQGPALQPAF